MHRYDDRIAEATATAGTGAFALAGALTGFRAFSAVCSVGDTVYYAVEGVALDGSLTGEWEVGLGTYSAAGTLARTTVLSSSNGGALVDFSAGTKQIWLDFPAAAVDALSLYANDHAVQWEDSATSAIDLLKLDSSNVFHVGPQSAPASGGDVAFWAGGSELMRLLATGVMSFACALSFPGSGEMLTTGELGARTAAVATQSISIGAPSDSGANLTGAHLGATVPATCTSNFFGYSSIISSDASAFTVSYLSHFYARQSVKGAGSTISNVIGFRAANAIAVGTSNFGFYSDINNASNTWQFYGAGTAQSCFYGPVGIGANNPLANAAWFMVTGAHPSTNSSIYGVFTDWTIPATATVSGTGFYSLIRTAASAFTVGTVRHFYAVSTNKGAGSTVSNVYGFVASNGIAVGTNNYGFYSDIASASNTYALYLAGTALSYIAGGVGIRASAGPGVSLAIGMPSTATAGGQCVNAGGSIPSTMTTEACGYTAQTLATQNAAFTLAWMVGYKSGYGWSRGAASTITRAVGFWAYSTLGTIGATSAYGYYSDLAASGTSVYAIYMGGTAPSYFGGTVGIYSTALDYVWLGIGGSGSPMPSTQATLYGVYLDYAAPSTAINGVTGYFSQLRTAASAFTLVAMKHFSANGAVKGAGSTITSVYGFAAHNALAVGTNNYGFYSDIAAATNTYQLYMAGTAPSYINGDLRIGTTALSSTSPYLTVGGASSHKATGPQGDTVSIDISAPSTMTSHLSGARMTLRSAASAFTLSQMIFYWANAGSKGAGSTVSSVYGFCAASGIAVGTNNYGFYSDINSATTTWQLYMGGTALNFLKGGLILDTTAAPTVGAGQVGFGATVQTTVGAAGAASALPATPTGYLKANVAGTDVVIPYYAAA